MALKDLTPQQVLRKRHSGEPMFPDENPQVHRHVISVLLENHDGALNRVVSMFSARGFNLESVAVGETEDPSISRLTLVTTGNDRIIAQVNRQLNRLIDTLEVMDMSAEPHVERELCVLKVSYTSENRAEIMDTVEIFRGKAIDINSDTMIFEVTGPWRKINAFVDLTLLDGRTQQSQNTQPIALLGTHGSLDVF